MKRLNSDEWYVIILGLHSKFSETLVDRTLKRTKMPSEKHRNQNVPNLPRSERSRKMSTARGSRMPNVRWIKYRAGNGILESRRLLTGSTRQRKPKSLLSLPRRKTRRSLLLLLRLAHLRRTQGGGREELHGEFHRGVGVEAEAEGRAKAPTKILNPILHRLLRHLRSLRLTLPKKRHPDQTIPIPTQS